MIRDILILIIVVFLAYFILSIEGVGDVAVNYIKKHTNPLRDRVEIFLEERRAIVEEEIEKEKDQIREEVKEKGKSLWERAVDYLIRLRIENQEEKNETY